MTTFDPGASVVFTHGLVSSPRSTAFLASRPAASITDGFDVLVQLVMAAMTTSPWFSSNWLPSDNVTGTLEWVPLGTVGSSPFGPWVPFGAPSPVTPSDAAGGSDAGNDC